MNKTIAIILALLTLLTLLTLCACGGQRTEAPKTETPMTGTPESETPETETPVTPTPTETPVTETPIPTETPVTETPVTPTTTETPVTETPIPTETPVSNEIVAKYESTTNNYTVEKSGETVEIKATKRAAAGDVITVTTPTNYLKIKQKNFEETILYLPEKTFTYKHQSNSSVFMPANLTFNLTLSTPTEAELAAVRNLALNPFDQAKDGVGFPHASSNNIYDQSGQFIARNAIDGFKSNTAHGNYPYESWGPSSTVRKNDYFTVEFGREVFVSSLTLYLRADGFGGSNSHDAYFSTIVLEFSDGTSVTVNPAKIKDAQTFTFDPVMTTSVKLTGFVTDKSDSQGWAAITELEIGGCDIIAE